MTALILNISDNIPGNLIFKINHPFGVVLFYRRLNIIKTLKITK